MQVQKGNILYVLCIFLFISSCYGFPNNQRSHYTPIVENISGSGKYVIVSRDSSTFKTWNKLANSVARSISKKAEKNPFIRSKPIYIMPGKDTPFEKSYRLLLVNSLTNQGFVIKEDPHDSFILKYSSRIINDNREVIVETYINDKSNIIFSDTSAFFISGYKDLKDYLIKLPTKQFIFVPKIQETEKIYHIVEN